MREKPGYRIRQISFLLLLLVLLLTGGCKKEASAPELSAPKEPSFDTEEEILQSEEEERQEETAKRPVRQVVDGKIKSYFTGEWIEEELGTRRPLAVMLNNHPQSLPMSGPSKASVIYECPVEKRTTRWMAVFEDWEDLARIGSVRSCRLYYLHLAQEFDAVYAHFGQAPYALEALNSKAFDCLSGATKGVEYPVSAMYDRISRPGKAKEHTLYAFPAGIAKDLEKKGYDMTMPEDYEGKFLFAEDGQSAEYEGYQKAVILKPGGDGGQNGFGGVKAVFTYNEADKKYYRSSYGRPHLDELTGEQVAVTNVIFQYCEGNVLDKNDYLHFATQSERGECQVFTNGKMIEGYWSNPGELGTPARYYDENDQEITLNQGTTFICLIWKDYKDDVVIE